MTDTHPGAEPGTDETLTKDLIVVSGSARTKEEAIREAGDLLVRSGAVTPAYVEAMLERERSISTYMGSYLAIPHGTNESKSGIVRSAVSLVRYDTPVDWDGNEVRVVVGIAGAGGEHLQILSKVAIVFSDDDLARAILEARTVDDIYDTLQAVNDE
jgi:mannitol/fructose-specific phosphotransferase system IIA component